MSLLNMGGQEIDLLNLKRMQQQMDQMNQQARQLGVNGIDTPQLGQQAPVPVQAPVQSPVQAPVQQQTPPQPKRNLFQRVGDALKDPIQNARIAEAFNQMRFAPSAGITANYNKMQELQVSQQKANQTVQYLRAQGRADLANIVEQDPTMASEVLKSMLGTQHMSKVGAIQTDPVTGQQYFTEYDPNTGKTRRVDVEGAIGETASQKAIREAGLLADTEDKNAAVERGQDIFDSAETLLDSIKKMESARDLAAGGDIQVGVFERYLPSMSADDAVFKNIRKDLGINVINSATFGALSEAELNLALSKDIPDTLEPAELIPYLDRQIAARRKLYREIMKKSRKLQSGIGLSNYIQQQDEQLQKHYQTLAAYPVGDPNMNYAMWNAMTSEDRTAYIEAEE